MINASSWTYGIGGVALSGTTHITGGKLVIASCAGAYKATAMAYKGSRVIIEGGTVSCSATANAGIYDASEGVIITGGNILSQGLGDIGILDGDNNYVQGVATNESGTNVYLTSIQLPSVAKDRIITSFVTSDNLTYGIDDMYTLDNGMIYVYLPAGTRTVYVTVDGTTYSGEVTTDSTNSQGVQSLQ